MSPRPKLLKFMGLLLVAVLAIGVYAGPASAKKYNAHQKRVISHKLLKQLKKHPKLLRKKSFLKKASAVEFRLPVTIRLNPDIIYPNLLCGALGLTAGCAGPVTADIPGVSSFGLQNSDDHALLDLGQSLGGVKTLKLGGQVEAYVDFKSPLDGGNLGDVDIFFKDSTASPALVANPVSVLTNPDVTTKNVEAGGCVDRANPVAGTPGQSGEYFGGAFPFLNGPNNGGSAAFIDKTLAYSGAGDVDVPANMPFMNAGAPTTQDTVLRASGPVTAQNSKGNIAIGINSLKSGGFANILGAGPSQVKLTLDLNLWTIIRGVDARSSGAFNVGGNNQILDPYDTNCRQAWGGMTHNVLHAVTGGDKNSLRISPAFTLDRRLRIAKIKFGSTGVTTHNTVRACLQPFSPYAQQATPISLFNWDHGTAADPTDDLIFPKPEGLRTQLGSFASVTPAPGTATSDVPGAAGLCDNYPTDTLNSFPSVGALPATQSAASSLLAGGSGLNTVPAGAGAHSGAPRFRIFPYEFHRLPGIESATCNYDGDGQPYGSALGDICTETGIQNSAIIDADITVQNLTAEVLVGQGIPAGPQ